MKATALKPPRQSMNAELNKNGCRIMRQPHKKWVVCGKPPYYPPGVTASISHFMLDVGRSPKCLHLVQARIRHLGLSPTQKKKREMGRRVPVARVWRRPERSVDRTRERIRSPFLKKRKKRSARRGSNPRPPPWQGGAPPLSHSRTSLIAIIIR